LATLKQKQDEYDAIAKQKKKYKASWYKQRTSLVMKDVDMDAQRKKHIDNFYAELVGVYKKSNGYANNFGNFPDEVQKALFDIIFNLGQTKLHTTFTKFNDAVKKKKWDDAAKQSNRPDVNAA
jgi:GH24 family phage-related lysozyme (muramidase)